MPNRITRPGASEYPAIFERYVARVPDGDVLASLASQIEDTLGLVGNLSPAQADFRYEPGKWSIKEVIGHIADTERIFAYRALCFARGEAAPLPGFDEDAYVAGANFSDRTLADLADEFRTVRAATLALFSGLDEPSLSRRGVANNREYSVRAVVSLVAGHERHHAAILRERYLART